MREAVFEPYWRAEATSGVEGAGLGLPVARAAARSMGGDITIESQVNVGTCASFTLPAELAVAPPAERLRA